MARDLRGRARHQWRVEKDTDLHDQGGCLLGLGSWAKIISAMHARVIADKGKE